MMENGRLLEKINALPPARLAEVEDFVDFIASKSLTNDRDASIAQFAAEFGGTDLDLDEALEAAGVDVLTSVGEDSK